MFYGWGKGSAQFGTPTGQTVLCVYRYLSVLFIFKWVTTRDWYLVGAEVAPAAAPAAGHTPVDGPTTSSDKARRKAAELSQTMGVALEPLSKADLAQLYMPDNAPKLGAFTRFGLLIPVLGLVAFLGIGAYASRGTSSVNAMKAGDCFLNTVTDEGVSTLTTPACSEPHDSQVIGFVDISDWPAQMPADTDPLWDSLVEECFAEADKRLIRASALPDDTEVAYLVPIEESWEVKDREATCYIYSSSGLPGSFITPPAD